MAQDQMSRLKDTLTQAFSAEGAGGPSMGMPDDASVGQVAPNSETEQFEAMGMDPVLSRMATDIEHLSAMVGTLFFLKEYPSYEKDKGAREFVQEFMNDNQRNLRLANWDYYSILQTGYARYLASKGKETDATRREQEDNVAEELVKGVATRGKEGAPPPRGSNRERPAHRMETAMKAWQKNAKRE